MSGNMLLEDVLAILGRVGTVTLRKGTNDVSASPGRTARKGWTCEISLAGYNNSGHTRTGLTEAGATATEAATKCLSGLERYLGSARAAEDRERYVAGWESQAARAGKRPDDIPPHRWVPCRHPGPMHPEAEISYGD